MSGPTTRSPNLTPRLQAVESDSVLIKSAGGALSIVHNRGAFATTTVYKANDLVTNAGSYYLAKVDFTSGGSFSAGDWNAIGGGGGGAVSSVAGRTGAVVLAVADVTGAAPLASPTFTGDPKAPTPSPGDNDTSIATTAFATAAVTAHAAATDPHADRAYADTLNTASSGQAIAFAIALGA